MISVAPGLESTTTNIHWHWFLAQQLRRNSASAVSNEEITYTRHCHCQPSKSVFIASIASVFPYLSMDCGWWIDGRTKECLWIAIILPLNIHPPTTNSQSPLYTVTQPEWERDTSSPSYLSKFPYLLISHSSATTLASFLWPPFRPPSRSRICRTIRWILLLSSSMSGRVVDVIFLWVGICRSGQGAAYSHRQIDRHTDGQSVKYSGDIALLVPPPSFV